MLRQEPIDFIAIDLHFGAEPKIDVQKDVEIAPDLVGVFVQIVKTLVPLLQPGTLLLQIAL